MITKLDLDTQQEKFEREVLADVITRPDLSLPQIAQQRGIVVQTVQYLMRKHGVPGRKPGRRPKRKKGTAKGSESCIKHEAVRS